MHAKDENNFGFEGPKNRERDSVEGSRFRGSPSGPHRARGPRPQQPFVPIWLGQNGEFRGLNLPVTPGHVYQTTLHKEDLLVRKTTPYIL